jgi:GTP:adenosylcobinamide-phosphate guanylyltransferase
LEKFDVILPAGGVLDDHFARVALTKHKALIKVQDFIVGSQSIDAVLESGLCRNVVLVGPAEVREAIGGRVTATVNDTGSLVKNIEMGIRELKSLGEISPRILILTTDLPYVNAKVLTQFVEMCPSDADIAAPLISKEEYLDRFPSATGTFVNLQDNQWTLGCAYLIKPDAFVKILPRLEKVIANRKNVFKMAGLLGFGFLWKVATRSITVPQVVSKLESVIGCKVVPVQGAPAEFANDIDDIVDYEYALRNK